MNNLRSFNGLLQCNSPRLHSFSALVFNRLKGAIPLRNFCVPFEPGRHTWRSDPSVERGQDTSSEPLSNVLPDLEKWIEALGRIISPKLIFGVALICAFLPYCADYRFEFPTVPFLLIPQHVY